jgi:hypothetical protein
MRKVLGIAAVSLFVTLTIAGVAIAQKCTFVQCNTVGSTTTCVCL